jgi:hypothetical protein
MQWTHSVRSFISNPFLLGSNYPFQQNIDFSIWNIEIWKIPRCVLEDPKKLTMLEGMGVDMDILQMVPRRLWETLPLPPSIIDRWCIRLFLPPLFMLDKDIAGWVEAAALAGLSILVVPEWNDSALVGDIHTGRLNASKESRARVLTFVAAILLILLVWFLISETLIVSKVEGRNAMVIEDERYGICVTVVCGTVSYV